MTKARLFALSIIALASCASGATVGLTNKAPTPSATPTTSAKSTPTPAATPEAVYKQEISDLAHALLSACYTIKPTKDVSQLFRCADAYVASVQAARKATPSPTPTPKPHLPVE